MDTKELWNGCYTIVNLFEGGHSNSEWLAALNGIYIGVWKLGSWAHPYLVCVAAEKFIPLIWEEIYMKVLGSGCRSIVHWFRGGHLIFRIQPWCMGEWIRYWDGWNEKCKMMNHKPVDISLEFLVELILRTRTRLFYQQLNLSLFCLSSPFFHSSFPSFSSV